MLGVHPDQRGAGLGRALKLAQRERALALGLDLIEVDVRSVAGHQRAPELREAGRRGRAIREENVYGEMQPAARWPARTDRFVCQWWIRRPHVVASPTRPA